MIKFVIVFALITASTTWADDLFVNCSTAMGPTTAFNLETKDDQVHLIVTHFNGMQFAPFWNNLVVPNDLDKLKNDSDLLVNLDPMLKAYWKKSDCKLIARKKFVCSGVTSKQVSNGIEVEPWAVYSSELKDSSFAGDFDYVLVSYSFYIKGNRHEFTMKYQDSECEVSNTKLNK